MFNAERLLGDLIAGGLSGGRRGSKRYRYRGSSGGLGGAIGRTALSPQGLTILGGLAIAAYEHIKGKQAAALPPPGPPSGSPAGPPPFPPPPDRALLLIEAMISASKADGEIDPEEKARILEHLDRQGEGPEARDFVERQMAQPLDLDRLVARVPDQALAAEVYAASLLAIDPDTPAERAYLALLSSRLGLDPGVIRALEAQLDGPENGPGPAAGA